MTTPQRLSQIRRLSESLQRIKEFDYIVSKAESFPGYLTPAQVEGAKLQLSQEYEFMGQVLAALKGEN
jgi:hypothetical protein